MDNFDLKKYLVENKVTRNSRMIKENEEVPFSDNNLKKVTVAGTTYEVGSDDPNDDGTIITIEKHPKGYFIMGQSGDEGYGYGVDMEGNIVDEDEIMENKVTANSRILNEDEDQSSENTMDVIKLGDKFFTLSNQVDLIPTEKWLQPRNIPTSKKKAAANAETFTEFEEILRADSPLIFTFETGDDYVETVYVYDLGDGNVAMVDDYVDGYSIHPKAAFEKFKEVLKQASGKTEA